MPVSQQGAINTTALIVPDIYVQIVPPQVTLLNGLPTNILGVVGTATWGPVNAPTTIGSMADYARQFGAIQARKFDMGTAVAAAVLQGASNFRCVRVTDGTDTAATATVQTNCITLTSKYTGTLGNSAQVSLASGSKSGTWRVTVAMPGLVPEIFDNIGEGLTANALWVAIAAAVNDEPLRWLREHNFRPLHVTLVAILVQQDAVFKAFECYGRAHIHRITGACRAVFNNFNASRRDVERYVGAFDDERLTGSQRRRVKLDSRHSLAFAACGSQYCLLPVLSRGFFVVHTDFEVLITAQAVTFDDLCQLAGPQREADGTWDIDLLTNMKRIRA